MCSDLEHVGHRGQSAQAQALVGSLGQTGGVGTRAGCLLADGHQADRTCLGESGTSGPVTTPRNLGAPLFFLPSQS